MHTKISLFPKKNLESTDLITLLYDNVLQLSTQFQPQTLHQAIGVHCSLHCCLGTDEQLCRGTLRHCWRGTVLHCCLGTEEHCCLLTVLHCWRGTELHCCCCTVRHCWRGTELQPPPPDEPKITKRHERDIEFLMYFTSSESSTTAPKYISSNSSSPL